MNWEDLTHLGSFAFKFVTDDGVWLAPPDSFQSGRKISGRHQLRFRSIKIGQGSCEFPNFESPESQKLDVLKRVRPTGEFGYRERADGSWFRAYAPRAKHMDLVLLAGETDSIETIHPMDLKEDGSWTVEFPEKATGKSYRLAITHHDHENPSESSKRKFLDPYALATVGREGPGIALNPLDPIPRSEAYEPPDMANLVAAEAHPRDLLAQAPIELSKEERLGIQRSYEMAEIRRLLPQETGRQRSRTSTDSRVRLSIERGIPLGLHAGEFHGSRFGLRERATKRFGNR